MRGAWPVELGLMVAAAVLFRLPTLAFMELNWDEGLYRLVAGRLLQGVAPYTEVWDRKPAGLFVLVAAMEALSGGGVVGLRLAMSVLVGVSAVLVAAVTRLVVPDLAWAPKVAGLVYVAGSLGNHGAGVNGELLLAPLALGGVLLALHAAVRGGWWWALAAGVALGAAAQVKQVALFDAAAALAMAVLWPGRGVSGESAWRLVLAGAAGMAVPLVAVLGWYGAIGALPLWWEANVTAVLSGSAPGMPRGVHLRPVLLAAPLLVLALALPLFPARRRLAAMLGVWAVCVGLGMAAVGRWLDHETLHGLPLLAVAIGVVTAEARARWRVTAVAAPAALALWFGAPTWIEAGEAVWRRARGEAHWGDRTAAVAAVLRDRVDGPGSLYVAGRLLELYRATGTAPPPTRFPFVPHLWLGYAPVDGAAEMARIMSAKPGFVVVDEYWLPRGGSAVPALGPLHTALRRDYVPEQVLRGPAADAAAAAVVFRRRGPPPP